MLGNRRCFYFIMWKHCVETCFKSLNGLLHKNRSVMISMQIIRRSRSTTLDRALSKTLPISALIPRLICLRAIFLHHCVDLSESSRLPRLLCWIGRISMLLQGLCENLERVGPRLGPANNVIY